MKSRGVRESGYERKNARCSPSPAGESNGVDDSLSPSPAGGRGGRGVRVVTAQPQAPKHLTHTDRMLAHERAAPLRPLAGEGEQNS